MKIVGKEISRLPIASITCLLQIPTYTKDGDTLVECRKYLERGTTTSVFSVQDNLAEIGDGVFIKDLDRYTHIKVCFGEIAILGDDVHACSKNGTILRKLNKGTRYKVTSIDYNVDDIALYGINGKEYISGSDNISFFMGTFIPTTDLILSTENKVCKYKKGEEIKYMRVVESRIQLVDGTWLNMDNLEGKVAV